VTTLSELKRLREAAELVRSGEKTATHDEWYGPIPLLDAMEAAYAALPDLLAIAAAAREWQRVDRPRSESVLWGVAGQALDAALSAPRPWTTGGQRLQPRRTTRAHRKHCQRLLCRQLAVEWAGRAS